MSLYNDVVGILSESQCGALMHGYDDEDVASVLPEGMAMTCVENVGGEDEGSTYFAVWKFTRGDEDTFIRFDGWYQSYNGAEFEECWEVEPAEKTIIYYKKSG